MNTKLETKHLTKWVTGAGGRVFLLRDINLTIESGEFISIMGPSGSGKSMLLNVFGIARALIPNPKLLLANEPTGNLNSKQGEEIMHVFSKLNKEDNVTIIQATHSERNAAYGNRNIVS